VKKHTSMGMLERKKAYGNHQARPYKLNCMTTSDMGRSIRTRTSMSGSCCRNGWDEKKAKEGKKKYQTNDGLYKNYSVGNGVVKFKGDGDSTENIL